MSYIHSRAQVSPIMVKKESTIGADPTPVGGTDDLLTYNSPNPFKAAFSRVSFQPHRSSFTRTTSTKTMRVWNVGFNFMFSGSGTRGDRTINGFKSIAALMNASGCQVAFTTSTSITISPATMTQLNTPAAASSGSGADCGPATIYHDADGKFHEANSVFGNTTMSFSPTNGVMCEFRGMGLYNPPTHTASEFSSWTGGTNRARACLGIGGTITGSGSAYTPRFRSATFDLGVSYEAIDDMNGATGLHSIQIVNRTPTLRCTIGMDSRDGGNLDYEQIYADLASTQTHAVSFTVDDNPSGTGSNGSICLFQFPFCDLLDIAPGGTGMRDITLTYDLTHATANSEWSISIT